MARRPTQRNNNIWFVFLLVVMLLGGFVVIGYWQTYDIKCFGPAGGDAKQWSWTEVPPKFVCRSF